MISGLSNLPKTTVHEIVSENSGMRKVCAKLVTKVLTDELTYRRVKMCQELLHCVRDVPNFLENVITGDESWIFDYDPEIKRQSSEWHNPGSPRLKKARMSKSKVKCLLIVFFDCKGVIH